MSQKLPLIETLVQNNGVVCLQEHFLSTKRLSLLKVQNVASTAISISIRRKSRGRPSGGLAILSRFQVQTIEVSDRFIASI